MKRVPIDLLLAVCAGIAWMLVCEHVLASRMLTGGATTGSDIDEHFWMLHSLGGPKWNDFSHNRYPLPTVFARAICTGETPFSCWRSAAFVSTGLLGGALWTWARAVGGRAAGFAALVLACTLPELVLSERTVTAYPEILAFWTLSAAAGAVAVARPNPWTVLAAATGVGLSLASDARGLLVALALLPGLAYATARAGWRGWPGAVLPIVLSWMFAAHQPVVTRSLEGLLETTIEMSYQHAGAVAPPRLEHEEVGWIWGRSSLWNVPGTLRFLAEANTRMHPGAADSGTQAIDRARRLDPLVLPLGLLLLGVPFALRGRAIRVLALLPTAPLLAFLVSAWQYEYYPRYAALGMSACAVLAGIGLVGFVSLAARLATPLAAPLRRRFGDPVPAFIRTVDARWLAVPFAVLLLVLPTPLALTASWRSPIGAQADLQRCIAGIPRPGPGFDECLKAQRSLLPEHIAWPF